MDCMEYMMMIYQILKLSEYIKPELSYNFGERSFTSFRMTAIGMTASVMLSLRSILVWSIDPSLPRDPSPRSGWQCFVQDDSSNGHAEPAKHLAKTVMLSLYCYDRESKDPRSNPLCALCIYQKYLPDISIKILKIFAIRKSITTV